MKCAVSSFFEICDREADGTPLADKLRIGARGGGFIIERGTATKACLSEADSDLVYINGYSSARAKTTKKVIELFRRKYDLPFVAVSHSVQPPTGMGFGTSGSGAIGTALALTDLFGLNLTLSQASDIAHSAEIDCLTGLGTVISLTSGIGPAGLVTEPGSFSKGRADSLVFDSAGFVLICACFGAIEKSTVLLNNEQREKVNTAGRETLEAILEKKTPEALLEYSRQFSENAGLASPELLKLCDTAMELGAVGATQNMIGNAIHCLVDKRKRDTFTTELAKHLGSAGYVFESNLATGCPVLD